MAYDEELAERVRDLIMGMADISERRMFGGLAFLVDGHMAVVVSGQGGLMARIDPRDQAGLVDGTAVEPMVMRGRAMSGWVRVAASAIADDRSLQEWTDRCVAYAASLPPKG
jgi:TfoX/Sxy family transcriptional regulator of competence genes